MGNAQGCATASFQPLAGVLRVHPPGVGYGGDWTWACTISLLDEHVYILGALRAPTPSEYRAARDCLFALGVRFAHWERHVDGEVRHVVKRL